MLKNSNLYENHDFTKENIQGFSDVLDAIKTSEIKTSKSKIHFALDGEDLYATINGVDYPIRETVKASLFGRLGLGGDTMKLLNDKELLGIIDIVKANYMTENVTVMVTDGAINSINSDKYAHIPIKEVYENTLNAVVPFFNGDITASIEADYAESNILFNTDKKFTFGGKERQLFIKLANSENGEASLKYNAFLGKSLLPIMSEIRIIHKGDKDLDSVDEALSSLEGVITQNVEAVSLLEDIQVTAPLTAVSELCSKAGLPKKVVKLVKEQIERAGNGATYTAAKLYEIIFDKTVEIGKSERYTNDTLKLLRYDWNEYSKATEVTSSSISTNLFAQMGLGL